MNKLSLLLVLLLTGMLYFASAVASQEEEEATQKAGPSGDEIVAMCESKFTAEEYADEEERNNLIDGCINQAVDSSQAGGEDA